MRPWLTAWMDMSSRRLVGWWISLSPNSDTLLAAFRHAVVAHGAPEEIIVDNGKDYRAKGVTGGKARVDEERVNGIMHRLGITVHWSQAYHPQGKPVERFFGTVCDGFSKRFETYCGKDPQSRPEELNKRLREGTIRTPGLEEVRDLFAAWAELYHNTTHSGAGMNGRTPAEAFTDNAIARRTAPPEILDLLLMRTERVTVSRNGVRFRGVTYGQSNLELWQLQGQEVDIRVDPTDASRVFVQDVDGRLICEARNTRLYGVSHDDIREGARRKAAARKLAKSAATTWDDRLTPVASIAQQIAAERRYAEQQSVRRKAAGAEGQTEARGVQLLPGASDVARSMASVQRTGGRGVSYARFADAGSAEDASGANAGRARSGFARLSAKGLAEDGIERERQGGQTVGERWAERNRVPEDPVDAGTALMELCGDGPSFARFAEEKSVGDALMEFCGAGPASALDEDDEPDPSAFAGLCDAYDDEDDQPEPPEGGADVA